MLSLSDAGSVRHIYFSIECQEIEPAKAYYGVNSPWQPACAENKGDKIEIEKSNQPPVDCADDTDCKSRYI